MSKTAMQILLGQIDFAIKQRENTSTIVDTKAVLLLMKEQATELLDKEKEQIKDAYRTGREHEATGTMSELMIIPEIFYQQKYN